jgi:hypothetical protein
MQPERRLQYADLRDLQELLGLTLMDFSWLMAFHVGANWVSKKPEHARKSVKDPVLSGLARLINLLATEDPDFHVLPRMPSAKDVFERLSAPYRRVTGRELKAGHFAALCLVSPPTVGDWLRSRPITIRSQRHLFLLDQLVTCRGDKGLKQYLDALDIEARSRGFESLDEVVRARSWAERRGQAGRRKLTAPGPEVRKSRREKPPRRSR